MNLLCIAQNTAGYLQRDLIPGSLQPAAGWSCSLHGSQCVDLKATPSSKTSDCKLTSLGQRRAMWHFASLSPWLSHSLHMRVKELPLMSPCCVFVYSLPHNRNLLPQKCQKRMFTCKATNPCERFVHAVISSYKTQFASLSPSVKKTCSLAKEMREAQCHMARSWLSEECQTTVGSLGGGSCLPVTQGTKVPPDVQALGAKSESKTFEYESGNEL